MAKNAGKRLCSKAGCGQPHLAKGFCSNHYKQFQRYGVPESINGGWFGGLRFLEQHVDDTGDECLIWPHRRDAEGYARARVDGRDVSACRLMCEMKSGPPPAEDAQAAHSCGRGHEGCVSPVHLNWSTVSLNALDKWQHGTMMHGEGHPKAKLSEAQVRLIIEDDRSSAQLARDLGCSKGMVEGVRRGLTWSWLTGRYHPSKMAAKLAHAEAIQS